MACTLRSVVGRCKPLISYDIFTMTHETAFVATYAILVSMKIVCFIIGYLIVRLGYQLLDSGVKGQFQFSAGWSKFKVGLASVSPGLLFVLLGSSLIGFAIYFDKEIEFGKEIVPGQEKEFKGAPSLENLTPPAPELLLPEETSEKETSNEEELSHIGK